MGPYGSVGAHIKTGESPMAQDHFKTPPDPKTTHKNPKMTQKSWLGSCWDNLITKKNRTLTFPQPGLPVGFLQ